MGPTKIATAFLIVGSALIAQTPQQSDQPHAWRRAEITDEQPQIAAAEPADPPLMAQGSPNQGPPPPPPSFTSNPNFGQPMNAPRVSSQMPPPQQQMQMSQQAMPARLSVRAGTFVTVRVNQFLSSDKNQQGDTFFASLGEPLIVDGVVVAQRGQTVMGRVTEAHKAGRVEGTARLGLELTGVTLVDGSQLPIQSQMIARDGGTSAGRDAGAIATTTALGAAIGAGADYGRGAAIGAGAGAAAGIIGVLLTRGHASQVYPETPLTFRITVPVEIATDRAPQAFRYAESRDYGQDRYAQVAPRRVIEQVAPAPYYYEPYYSPYSYGYGYGYGPSFSFGYGYGYPYRSYYGGYGYGYGGGGIRGGISIRGGGGSRGGVSIRGGGGSRGGRR